MTDIREVLGAEAVVAERALSTSPTIMLSDGTRFYRQGRDLNAYRKGWYQLPPGSRYLPRHIVYRPTTFDVLTEIAHLIEIAEEANA